MTNQASVNGPPQLLTQQTEILNHCLQAIEKGEASIESCVQQVPHFPELGDLLHAIQAVQSLPQVTLAPSAREAIHQRMLAAYRQQPIPQPTTRVPLRRALVGSGVAAAIFLGMMLLFFARGSTGGQASQQPPTREVTQATQPAAARTLEATSTVEPSRTPAPSNTPIPTVTASVTATNTIEATRIATIQPSPTVSKPTATVTSQPPNTPTARPTNTAAPLVIQDDLTQSGSLGAIVNATSTAIGQQHSNQQGNNGVGQGQSSDSSDKSNNGVGQGVGGGRDDNRGVGQGQGGGQDNNKGKD